MTSINFYFRRLHLTSLLLLFSCSQCTKENVNSGWSPRNACLAYLSFSIGTNKCLDCYLFAAIIGSCVSQIMSIWLKTPSVIFSLAILAPLVPGYRAYMSTTYFVSGEYAQALTNITTVLTLALVIPIGMASGTILLRLYKVMNAHKNSV